MSGCLPQTQSLIAFKTPSIALFILTRSSQQPVLVIVLSLPVAVTSASVNLSGVGVVPLPVKRSITFPILPALSCVVLCPIPDKDFPKRLIKFQIGMIIEFSPPIAPTNNAPNAVIPINILPNKLLKIPDIKL